MNAVRKRSRSSRLDALPVEIRLLILSFVPPSDLWLHVRNINKCYAQEAKDVALNHLIPQFQIRHRFILGSGDAPRWYSLTGTVHLGFVRVHSVNPQYALFEIASIVPEGKWDHVLETWKRMCASGFGSAQEWRVKMDGAPEVLLRMPKLVTSDSDGLFCDWRELLDQYFARVPEIYKEWLDNRIGDVIR